MTLQEINIKTGRYYGISSQLSQMQEEAAELIVAINKYRRARGVGQYTGESDEESRAAVVEELVDLSIMAEQMCDLMGVTVEEFDKVYREKVERTARRRGWTEKNC